MSKRVVVLDGGVDARRMLADRILHGTYGDASKTARQESPRRTSVAGLAAVEAGRAKPVADETWFLGVVGAEAVLTDLEKQVTPWAAGPGAEGAGPRSLSGRRAAGSGARRGARCASRGRRSSG